MLKTAQILRRFAFDEWGGTENSLWNSVFGLRSHNIDSQILSTTAMAPVEFEERGGIEIRRFPYYYPYWPLSEEDKHRLDRRGGNPVSLPLYRYLQSTDFDLLHVHSSGRIAGMVRAAAKQRKIPYIVSFHRGYLQTPETPAASHLLLRQIHRAGLRLAPEFHFRRRRHRLRRRGRG